MEEKISPDNIVRISELLALSLKNNPYWEEVKRKVRVRDGHCCRMCGKTYNLEIHHKTYQIGGMSIVGHELEHLGCLVTLCEECHAKVHER